MKILSQENNISRSFQLSNYLSDLFPNNSIFHGVNNSLLYRSGRFNECEKESLIIIENFKNNKYGYKHNLVRQAAFFLGEIYNSKSEIELSKKYYNESIEIAKIIDAEKTRKSLVLAMQLFFEDNDFLICPSTSVTPFNIEKPFVTEIDGQQCETYIDWFSITFALTMTGCPVVSLPCGFHKNGLPVGVQVLGKPRQEAKLLSFCSQLEKLFDVSKNVPLEI